MVGQTIGKYRVVSRLGRGGMGTVYKAVDQTLDREVAIKCLNSDLSDSDVLKRFRAEAMTLARMNHPNIATLFELTEHEGQMLMVMEFVRGETFEKVAERLGEMSISRTVELCTQVLDALSHAHRAGIVHRDLKPANLMLSESGIVKVMDFGLARMAGTEHLTNDGYMVGTPAYMSPEQVLGGEVDGRADLYAMGVLIYRMLTGRLPFKADSGIAMAQKQIHDAPTPVRQLRAELPSICEDLFTRALAKSPDERYQTADQLKAALRLLSDHVSSEETRTLVSPMPQARVDPALEATIPTPVSTVRPASAPAPAPAPVAKMPVAVMAAAVVVLAAIPTTFFIWNGRPAVPAVPAAALAPAPASAPVAAPSPPPASVAAAPATPPTSTTSAAAVTGPPKAKPPAVPARPAIPVVTFGKLKFLTVQVDGKAKDQDAELRLERDVLHVVDAGTTLRTAAYRDVIGLFYSHSKEPRWAGPDGASMPIAKVGGKFSFFKGTPDWVTVRTKAGFIPLRVNDDDLRRVMAELEARTGTRIVRAK